MKATLTVILSLVAGVTMAAQDEAQKKALAAPFEAMEKGIKGPDEAAFKAVWQADAYEKNFVGGSGLAGKKVFGQGSRKKWFLKPDFAKQTLLADGAVAIVTCDVWAWEKEKALGHVDMIVVKEKDGYVVLGGGEKRAEVDALAQRFIKKEPLELPAKEEK